MLSKKQLMKLEKASIKIITDSTGRISSENELIVQNLLISTDLDFELVSDLTGLDIAKIISIYIKYETFIDKVIHNIDEDDKTNKAIEQAIDLLADHINAIAKLHKQCGNKSLMNGELNQICKILDRLVAIKNAKISSFDKITAGLISATAKLKTLEKLEMNQLEFTVDSNYNFSTIADKLDAIMTSANITKTNKDVKYYVHDTEEDTLTSYPSQQKICQELAIGHSSIGKYIDTNLPYKERYFIYTEDNYIKMKNENS